MIHAMRTRYLGLLVALTGVLIIAGGFLYNVVFAGIPYQDPTPTLQQQYTFHAGVAQAAYIVGAVVIGIGLLILALQLYRRRSTR